MAAVRLGSEVAVRPTIPCDRAAHLAIAALITALVGCAPLAPNPGSQAVGGAAPPGRGPATEAPAAVTPPPAPVTVRVGVLSSIGDAPFVIGKEKGFYAEQGIALEFIPFDSAARMIAPLSAGQLDTGQGVISAGALNAVARGVGIKGISAASGSPPGHGNSAFLVRRDLADQLRSPADLRGRKLGLSATGTGVEVLWNELLRRGSLSASDVEFVQLNFTEQVAALCNQALDMAATAEPATTLAIDRGCGQVYAYADEIIPNHLTSLIWASPQFLAQPELVQRFAVALVRSIRVYNDGFIKGDPQVKAELVPMFIAHTPVKDPSLYDRMVFQGIDPDGRVNRESIEGDMRYYLATGQMPAPVDLDLLLDSRFTDYAVQVLGPYPR